MVGGQDGLFLEKPDIIDKYCRREITENKPELEELSPMQFGKMYDPITRKKQKKEDEDGSIMDIDTDEIDRNGNVSTDSTDDPWVDDEDRIANYFITANPDYHYVPLPQYIKIKNPNPGEVTIFEKRSFPKAARIHKKKRIITPIDSSCQN